MSVGAQMVVVLKAFVERCVSLVLGHPFEFPGSRYAEQMYFINSSLFPVTPDGRQLEIPTGEIIVDAGQTPCFL
jgi:hypothetical protein